MNVRFCFPTYVRFYFPFTATRSEFDSVDWKGYIGLRIKVVHVYFGIDYKIIWNVITKELAGLYAELSAINDKLLL
jgi:uncharacterized protein with HEPN domain